MSNPLKRRMAKAALVLAAGAAPVIGSAAGASALSLPPATDLGTLSNVDAGMVGETAEGAMDAANALAGDAAGDAVQQTVPAALDATGAVTSGSGALLGKTTSTVTETGVPGNMPTGSMPVGLLG